MGRQEQDLRPGTVRKSPTGRIPQWALDEAIGKPVDPVPFRGPTTSLLTPRGPKRGRGSSPWIGWLALALFLVVAALFLPAVTGEGRVLGPQNDTARLDDAPPPGVEESKSPLAAPPDQTSLVEGQGFRFARHENGDNQAVTWSPCRPLHYVTRPDNAPAGGSAMIADAVARVSAASSLTFIDDGPTTEGPSEDRSFYQPNRYGNRWAPVLVAWATRSEVPDFGVDIAGEAGAAAVTTPSGDMTYVSGVIYLDPIKINDIRLRAGEAAARTVILHEFGHLVGLAHVDDGRQVMFPRGSGTVTDFQQGDRAGLAALGRGPCQPDV
ncbi:MAG: matrixin family metalloprotease [Actinomycetota bacterium]|nr:matrixin family metalloprotease [Actinomycetota bacterium]